MVKELKNIQEFVDAVGDENTGLVIIDFFADWCGPCKMIAPKYNKMETTYTTVGFYKINVDNKELEEVCQTCNIRSMPTFCFFKKGKYLTCMLGANDVQLEKLVKQYS